MTCDVFDPGPVHLPAEPMAHPFVSNRQLLDWLGHERRRDELFDRIGQCPEGVLRFASRAVRHETDFVPAGSPVLQDPASGHKPVYLVTRRAHIERALLNVDGEFSNAPYDALGSGTFLLGLDDPRLRTRQRDAAWQSLGAPAAATAFRLGADTVQALCEAARDDASLISLGMPQFDLAAYAEQAALRFCSLLFGFASRDFPLIEEAMRQSYAALTYQILGRHFVTEPGTLPGARLAMGALLVRASALIDDYQHLQGDTWPDGVDGEGFRRLAHEPVLKKLARLDSDLNGEERGVLVVGLMAGMVGNVQAAVCGAVRSLFEAGQLEAARAAAQARPAALWGWIAEALRLHPPASYLPRRATREVALGPGMTLPAGADCILAIVAATRHGGTAFRPPAADASRPPDDRLLFGLPPGPPHAGGLHACVGTHLAQPLVTALVRQVIFLPGLAESLDPADGCVVGLQRRWGFACTHYPMTHRLDKRRRQRSLNVSMRVKAPMAVHADHLRGVIRVGAPLVERALRDSRHIHFAWFEFTDNDTRLVLHTVYDGNFDAYIQHFALAVGPLFDMIFLHIEDAPPMPVSKFPGAFVELIRRNDRAPAAGYFFSAYPGLEAAQIARDARAPGALA